MSVDDTLMCSFQVNCVSVTLTLVALHPCTSSRAGLPPAVVVFADSEASREEAKVPVCNESAARHATAGMTLRHVTAPLAPAAQCAGPWWRAWPLCVSHDCAPVDQGRRGSAPPLRWSAQPCPFRAFPALGPGRTNAGKRNAAPNAAPWGRARGAATLGGEGSHRVHARVALVSPALSLPRLPCTGPGQGKGRDTKCRAQCGARGARVGRRHPGRHRVDRVSAPAALVSPALSLPRLPCTAPGLAN